MLLNSFLAIIICDFSTNQLINLLLLFAAYPLELVVRFFEEHIECGE